MPSTKFSLGGRGSAAVPRRAEPLLYGGALALLIATATVVSLSSLSRSPAPPRFQPHHRHPPGPGRPRPPAARKRQTAWRFLRLALYASLLAALLALAVALGAAALPRLLGYRALVVSGGSMGEALPNGSLAVARWLPAEEVRVGDVILVQTSDAAGPARPKLHRVVSLQPDGSRLLVRTRGDANHASDPGSYVLPHRVLTPAYTLPYLGYLAGFAGTPLGWALLVLLPGAIVCALTLRDIWAPERAPAQAAP
ncbi:MAG TPA: signal peptidase I [Dehalococcoidia bacterium]|nr:signal peptidase I [Dehalococcoidia bacterium]